MPIRSAGAIDSIVAVESGDFRDLAVGGGHEEIGVGRHHPLGIAEEGECKHPHQQQRRGEKPEPGRHGRCRVRGGPPAEAENGC